MTRSGSTFRTSRSSKNEQGHYRLPVIVAVTTLLAVGIVPVAGVVLAQAQSAPARVAAAKPRAVADPPIKLVSGATTSLCIQPDPAPSETPSGGSGGAGPKITVDPFPTHPVPPRTCTPSTQTTASVLTDQPPAAYAAIPSTNTVDPPTPTGFAAAQWVGPNTAGSGTGAEWYIYDAHFNLSCANASIQIYAWADNTAGVFLNSHYLNSQVDPGPGDTIGHNFGHQVNGNTPLQYPPEDLANGGEPFGPPGGGFVTGNNVVEFAVHDDGGSTGVDFSMIVTPGPCGTLKICKVAGSGVPVNSNFTFTIPVSAPNGGDPGLLLMVVPAGPAPGGYCKIVPRQFAPGEQVSIHEAVPNADQVTSISTNAAVFNSPQSGVINVTMLPASSGAGVTEVTFTNASKKSGFVEICKTVTVKSGSPPTTLFHFVVTGAPPLAVAVPAGACSPAINVPAGIYTVTETPFPSGFVMTGCSSIPATAIVAGSCNIVLHKVKVGVAAGGISSETILTFKNRKK